jgi:transposase
MEAMGNGRRPYPPEFRERAVRLVYEWRAARDQDYGGFYEIAEQLGIHGESIRNWMRQGEIDSRQRPGVTTSEQSRLVQLERENRELRRANEILKSAAAFFARELDPQPRS